LEMLPRPSNQESGRAKAKAQSKQQTKQPETNFHKYHLLVARLGKGAFARVYSARRCTAPDCGRAGVASGSPVPDDTQEEVAVKVTDLRSTIGADAKAGKARQLDFRRWRATEREAHVLRLVQGQKHCVAFFESIVEGFFSYIVMEKCDKSLLQMLETSPAYTEYTLKNVLGGMLNALHAIHSVGVVHRDVKPDNYLCSGPDDTVKLCDYGLADVVTEQKPELKDVYGTAPFMSPEMLSGGPYGTQTDMWSFGVIAYVMLLGQFPYRPLDRTSKGMKSAILSGIPEPPFRPKAQLQRYVPVSPGATCFLRLLLCRDPSARPTAERALRIAWLRIAATPEEQARAPSLHPMFESAKHAGAFTVAGSRADEGCAVEVELNMLQAQYHRKEDIMFNNAKRSDTDSTQACSSSVIANSRSSKEVGSANSPAATYGVYAADQYEYIATPPMSGWQTPPQTPDWIGQAIPWAGDQNWPMLQQQS